MLVRSLGASCIDASFFLFCKIKVVGVPEDSKEQLFVPPGLDLLAPLADCKASIDVLLDKLPEMFKDSKVITTHCCVDTIS